MGRLPKEISIETFVDNGKLTKNRDLVEDAIKKFEGKPITMVIKRFFKKRSNRQNNYWHGVIVEHWRNIIREEWGEIMNHDEVHEFLKANLNYEEFVDVDTGEVMLNEITGLPIRKPKSTKENTTFSQEELHEAARQLAWNMFSYQIPLPDSKLRAEFV